MENTRLDVYVVRVLVHLGASWCLRSYSAGQTARCNTEWQKPISQFWEATCLSLWKHSRVAMQQRCFSRRTTTLVSLQPHAHTCVFKGHKTCIQDCSVDLAHPSPLQKNQVRRLPSRRQLTGETVPGKLWTVYYALFSSVAQMRF